MKKLELYPWTFTESVSSTSILHEINPFTPAIKDYLIRPNIQKSKRECIYLCKFKPTFDILRKSYNDISRTDWVFIDFDFKEKDIRDKFTKDYKNNKFDNFEDAFNDFHQFLLTYKHSFAAGLSGSRKGLRIISLIKTGIYIDDYEVSLVHKKMVKKLVTLLRDEVNIMFYNNKEIDYIDPASYRATQPTFSMDEGIINKSFETIEYLSVKDELIKEMDKLDKVENFTTLLDGKPIKEMNDEEVIKIVNKHNHYDYTTLLMINELPDNQQRIAYNEMVNNYVGDGMKRDLSSFESFKKRLDRTKGDYFGWSTENNNTYDTFGYSYDITIKYNKYITEKAKELNDIITNEHNVIIKAPAGGGKTTYFRNWCDNLKGGDVIVFAAPTNAILEQTALKFNNNFQVLKNYNSEKRNWASLSVNKPVIILSSFKSLYKLKKLNIKKIFIDEVHNLVNQSDFDNDFTILEHKSCVYLSATPETFLNTLNDFYYINLDNNLPKKELDIILCKKEVKNIFLDYIIDYTKKQLIYINNKDQADLMNRMIIEDIIQLSGDTGRTMILSSEKKNDDEYIRLLNESLLIKDTVLSTQIINEGVNILNKEWDEVIILDDRNITYLDIYQLSNRFRKLPKVNIKFLTNGFPNNLICRGTFDIKGEYLKAFKYYTSLVKNKRFENNKLIENKRLNELFMNVNNCYSVNKYKLNKRIVDKYFSILRNNYQIYNKFLSYFFDVNTIFLNIDSKYDRSFRTHDNGVREAKENISKQWSDVDDYFNHKTVSKKLLYSFKKNETKLREYYDRVKYLAEMLREEYNDLCRDTEIEARTLLTNSNYSNKKIIEQRCKNASKNIMRSKNSRIDKLNIINLISYLFKEINRKDYISVNEVNDIFNRSSEDINILCLNLGIKSKRDLQWYLENVLNKKMKRINGIQTRIYKKIHKK